MIAEVDKDGSGTIDFDEFVHMMTDKMGERDARDELMKAFRIIDQDNNVIDRLIKRASLFRLQNCCSPVVVYLQMTHACMHRVFVSAPGEDI